jgi:hypothetical protein
MNAWLRRGLSQARSVGMPSVALHLPPRRKASATSTALTALTT